MEQDEGNSVISWSKFKLPVKGVIIKYHGFLKPKNYVKASKFLRESHATQEAIKSYSKVTMVFYHAVKNLNAIDSFGGQ